MAPDVVQAVGVVDLGAVLGRSSGEIGHRTAVLGDHQLREPVAVVEVTEESTEAGRVDLPPHRRRGELLRPLAVRRDGAHDVTTVEVDAEQVDRPGDQFHVPVAHLGALPAESVGGGLRVAEAGDGVGVPPVLQVVLDGARVDVGRGGGRRCRRREVQHDRQVGVRGHRADPLTGECVGEQEMVRGGEPLLQGGVARGVFAGHVAVVGGDVRLVQGGPGPHPVAEAVHDGLRVVGERLGGVS